MNRVEFEVGTKKNTEIEEKRVQVAKNDGDDIYAATTSLGAVEISLIDLSILFLSR